MNRQVEICISISVNVWRTKGWHQRLWFECITSAKHSISKKNIRMSRNVVMSTKRWILIHKISRMYKKIQLIFSYGNFFLSKGWPCFPITFAMPPFSLRCIRMQLSRWIDGNSVEVEDGWVSVEVNCHLTDGEENTARPKRSREVATAQRRFIWNAIFQHCQ